LPLKELLEKQYNSRPITKKLRVFTYEGKYSREVIVNGKPVDVCCYEAQFIDNQVMKMPLRQNN